MIAVLKITATVLVVCGALLIALSSILTMRYRQKVDRVERLSASASRRPASCIGMVVLLGSYIVVLPAVLSRNIALAAKLLPVPLLTFAVTQYVDLRHFQKLQAQGVFSKEACALWIVPGYFGIVGCIAGCCGAFVYLIATFISLSS